MQFLFQHIHRYIAVLNCGSLLLRFGQGAFVDLLVLVQGNGVYLHGHCRYHIWRFLVEDEIVQGLDVDLLVAHDVGCDELSASFLVERLDGGVLDAFELTDDGFHLFQLDSEAADLHLAVAASHELDIAVGQIAYDVACAVGPYVFVVIISGEERVADKDLGSLLWTVQITLAYLRAGYPQLTCSSDGQAVAISVHHIQAHVVEGSSDGYLFQFAINQIGGGEDGALCGAISIIEMIAFWRGNGGQFLAACGEIQQRMVLDAGGELVAHLGRHE